MSRIKIGEASGLGIVVVMVAVLGLVPLVLFLATCMFEYSFWVFFGKELPWYLDFLGAVVLNGANLVVWIVSLIIDVCGGTPVFPNAFL